MIDVLLAAILATYHPPRVVLALQDTGYGKCPAFSHYHPTFEEVAHGHDQITYKDFIFDGLCHRDEDDSSIEPHGPVLPVPHDYDLPGIVIL